MPIPEPTALSSRTLLRDEVGDRLRAAILDGTLEPGERLYDEHLISWLGVSRTPIREALAALADEGLIEMVANRYTRVTLPDPEEALDALHALGFLMSGIVRLTVPVMTSREVAATTQQIGRAIERLPAGGARRIILTLTEAYAAWLSLCPNPILVDMTRKFISGLAFKLREANIEDIAPVDHFVRQYGRLQHAVARRDLATAAHAIEAIHLLDEGTLR